eukprot:TRINITY_DN4395_c0_g1_i1.p1 TRINITY_DN4395_c0_g1~~TRINITY_DN4395_c0_g1_i1.p1  ORF type:complete len:306 (-),score=87.45 TRINITY_DN4395_c0_g1_i1:187-1104(-)
MTIYAISDLHTDYDDNLKWVTEISDVEYIDDCLIVAGDVTDNLLKLEYTFKLLVSKFKQVFFCPGNHEVWINKVDEETHHIFCSFSKFDKVIEICDKLGVKTTPSVFDGILIVPLFAWYDKTLHIEHPILTSDYKLWSDTYRCKWPLDTTNEEIVSRFLKMNERHIPPSPPPSSVITFSHFFSSLELMTAYMAEIERRWKSTTTTTSLSSPSPSPSPSTPSTSTASTTNKSASDIRANFSLVAGTQQLDSQIKRWNSSVHIFGHSHRKMEFKIEGVRYINNPLGYPRERLSSLISGPFLPIVILP